MNDIGVLIFIVLILVVLVLGGTLGLFLLTNSDKFLDYAFPKKKPGWDIFLSKNKEDGEKLIVYYGGRGFFVCFLFLLLILILRSLGLL